MSHIRTKIKYKSESGYGSTEEKYLYCHHNLTCDVVTVYDNEGEILFSLEDAGYKNGITQLLKLLTKIIPENDPDILYMNIEDRIKCKIE